MLFTQSNPTVLSRKEFDSSNTDHMLRLVRAISGEQASAEMAIRAVGALGALVIGVLRMPTASALVPGKPAEREAAARTVALEMLASMRRD